MYIGVRCVFDLSYFSYLVCNTLCNNYSDIDECDGDHLCEHDCINIVGSYECACEIGYALQDNGVNCSGLHY